MPRPITVAIERHVDPARVTYAQSWIRQGIGLAERQAGFLGAGWVADESSTFHMLYRFADSASLEAWENSPERQLWLAAGSEFASESRVERRTGIEGWFDSAEGEGLETDRIEIRSAEPAPPRWKQTVIVWLAFFPLNLLTTWLLGFIPGFTEQPLWLRLLVASVLLTPVMVGFVLPFVTRAARPWLLRGR